MTQPTKSPIPSKVNYPEVVDQTGILLGVLEFVDHKTHRLRDVGASLGVVGHAARTRSVGEAVAVGQPRGPGLHEETVGSPSTVQLAGEKIEDRLITRVIPVTSPSGEEDNAVAGAAVDQPDIGWLDQIRFPFLQTRDDPVRRPILLPD